MAYLVDSNVQLARVLGVTAPAVAKAEAAGRITRRDDGRWDIMTVLCQWRRNTWSTLQRPERGVTFRPWLDADVPLARSIRFEVIRRAVAEGAERVPDDPPSGGDFPDLILED